MTGYRDFFFFPNAFCAPQVGTLQGDTEHSDEDDAGGFPSGLLVWSESLDDVGDGRTKAKCFLLQLQIREHVRMPHPIPGPRDRRVVGNDGRG